jgi:CheY-like chemotaxis protein
MATQITRRLEALRYRVVTISRPDELVSRAEHEMPMVILADLEAGRGDVASAIGRLRANAPTSHVPVISFAAEVNDATQASLAASGATNLVSEAAVLSHLPQLLDRALDIH